VVVFRETGVRIGNQIDLNRSRVVINLGKFDETELRNYIDKANLSIKEDLPPYIKELPRARRLRSRSGKINNEYAGR
jgi:Ser-tRNA(Ala) deacylase AlaX